MSNPNILIYDIESTHLKGDFGSCIAFGYKLFGKRGVKVLTPLQYHGPCKTCGRVHVSNDSALLQDVHTVLSKADMWVTWYGKGFDHKFLTARMVQMGLPPLPPVPHVDLYFTAKTNLALSSYRLANVQNFLGLASQKTPLTPSTWRKAQDGDVASLKYVALHCRKDVEVLDQAYAILRPYVRQHPRVGGTSGCRVCGSAALKRNGVRLTVTKGPRIEWVCTVCGHSERRAT